MRVDIAYDIDRAIQAAHEARVRDGILMIVPCLAGVP